MLRRKTTVVCILALAASGLFASAAEPPKTDDKPVRVLLFAGAATHEYQFVQALLVREMEKGRVKVSAYLQPPPGRKEPREGVLQDAHLLTKFPDAIERKKSEDVDSEYELASYDVIVAFDPDWTQLSEEQTKLLKMWTEGGGGLVVVAGPVNTAKLSRKANADKLKSVLDLYPVVVGDNRLDEIDRPTDALYPLHFTADKGPSFLILDPEGKGPLAGWDDFFYGVHGDVKNPELKRGFYSTYPVDSVKPGATVWATFGDPMGKLLDAETGPFLVGQTVEKGRVVYLGSGEMWRLRAYKEAFYGRFWTGLVRYTAGRAAAEKEAPPDKAPKPSPDELSMEVDALRLLYAFDFTPDQRADLEKRAKDTTEPARKRKAAKVSEEYLRALNELRDALIDASDDDAIDAKDDALTAIEDKESPDLDDDVKLTDPARKQAGEVFQGLKASQLTTFLERQGEDEAPDPRERLVKALTEVRGLKRDEWTDERDTIAEDVVEALAGANADKADKVNDLVVALLSKARGLTEKEFKAKKADLEKAVDEIVGAVGPDEVVKNRAEHALAELLSNPLLGEALKARSK